MAMEEGPVRTVAQVDVSGGRPWLGALKTSTGAAFIVRASRQMVHLFEDSVLRVVWCFPEEVTSLAAGLAVPVSASRARELKNDKEARLLVLTVTGMLWCIPFATSTPQTGTRGGEESTVDEQDDFDIFKPMDIDVKLGEDTSDITMSNSLPSSEVLPPKIHHVQFAPLPVNIHAHTAPPLHQPAVVIVNGTWRPLMGPLSAGSIVCCVTSVDPGGSDVAMVVGSGTAPLLLALSHPAMQPAAVRSSPRGLQPTAACSHPQVASPGGTGGG
eukprot:CAMPEP_0118938314 /NCGR_PEP_ID=MMETSP1169-20130426/25459_1 /TAXON_ID=36882 /ORGANISM="Pyramimonas obovata, Strain CCMP722" /LENGTH=270 /DNA_ID=CAMNT_0006882213 /DNA_START=146 /DNA_END=955 /DNA_ORIENTATION=+